MTERNAMDPKFQQIIDDAANVLRTTLARELSDLDVKDAKDARIEALEAENARLMEALTPSANTKADYIGEFHMGVTFMLGHEEEHRSVQIPWTSIKEIMAAIRARALKKTEVENG